MAAVLRNLTAMLRNVAAMFQNVAAMLVLNQIPSNPNLGLDWIELGWKLGWVVTIYR